MAGSLVPRPDPARQERRVAAALLVATCITVFAVHWLTWQDPATGPRAGIRAVGFTAALMGILLAHELGHVVVARSHRFVLGLPWFLPFPFLVGTLGAVIRLREAPRDRTGLLEMGAAGPLVGLGAIAVVAVAWVLAGPVVGEQTEGVRLATPLVLHAVHVVFTGALASPVAPTDPLGFAAWIGCLVTAMNLVPLGQLDGGHVASALWPRFARRIGWGSTAGLLALGLFWPGWAVWAVMLHLMGARHRAPVRDESQPVSGRGRWVAAAAALAFVACFTPIPVAGAWWPW
jgi:membrane-associated protease RseP (regulator of RpoE activity)